MKSKKEIREQFKTMKFRAGIAGIRNKMNQKIYPIISPDLDRAHNSDVFQLKAGMHKNAALQNDWNELGTDAFEMVIIDELNVSDSSTAAEIEKELKELLEMHLSEFNKKDILIY